MLINLAMAEEIMKEIKSVLPFYFNIMNESGTILACSDPRRNGTQHAGTALIRKHNLNELMVERDNQYPGCRMGVVLPLYFAKKIIGFVGIAGKPSTTILYGRLIQRMVEMLVCEKFESSQRRKDEESREGFIWNLITGNTTQLDFNVEEALMQYELDRKGPFTVGILKRPTLEREDSNSDLLRARQEITVRYLLRELNGKSTLAAVREDCCIFLTNRTWDKIHLQLSHLAEYIREMYSFPVLAVTGNPYESYLDIPHSYKEANSMLQYYESQGTKGIFFYDPTVLDFIISQISTGHRENLSRRVFLDCSNEEIADFCDFLTTYFDCNGSLNALSQKYFIHKNTVQYKIHKIQKKTGLDIRSTHDLFLLYLAAIADTKKEPS